MENPFRFGEIVRGYHFTGREREIAELTSDIRSGQNVVVISPRRYGKTSLVLATLDQLPEREVLRAYVDLLRAPTIDRLPNLLAGAIYSGLVSPLARTWDRAGQIFTNLPLRPKLVVASDGSVEVEFAPGAAQPDLHSTIERLLELPGKIARERDVRVALVLDEFQAVVDLDPHLPALMRAIFQQQAEVAHVFLGSRRHLMARLFTDENEPMFRLAKPIPLGPLARDRFAQFIQDRFAATRTPIETAAVDRVLDLTGGHPNDTQELCAFLWAIGSTGKSFPIAADVVDEALERVLDAESARFLTIWERLPGPQRALYAAIATEPGLGIYKKDFRDRHGLGDPAHVRRSIERLLDLGLVETIPGPTTAYRVTDTFVAAWLCRIGVIVG